MQERASQQIFQQMSSVCLSGFQGNKQTKPYKNICYLFIKQILDSQKNKKNQEPNIHIFVCSDEKNNSQGNQNFILGCLLFLFLKYRSLKVMFEVYSKQQIKSIDRQKNITLNINKIDLKPEFYNKICAFISKKQKQYHESFNFFKEICFKTKCQLPNKVTNQITKLRLDALYMIHIFYKQLSYIMANKNIYLLKNTISGYRETILQQEKMYFIKIMENLRQIYTLVYVFNNIPQCSLLHLVSPQRKQINQAEMLNDQQQEMLEKGAFKQFKGITIQYLQKLVIVIKGTKDQITDIIRFLQKTPNLSFLQIHNKTNNQIVLPDIQQLLQTIIEHVPHIKKINFVKFRMEGIELDLLQKLYVNCPFLVDLSIGLTFDHSIMETYQIENIQDKKALELERQKLLILQALRLRNITLNNSFQTAKLLLKKGYNFLSALQIIDCIQPICV